MSDLPLDQMEQALDEGRSMTAFRLLAEHAPSWLAAARERDALREWAENIVIWIEEDCGADLPFPMPTLEGTDNGQ